jgi:hypothetical protein
MFGDDDPEDGWDAGDPVHVKVAILVSVLRHVAAEHATRGATARHQVRVAWLIARIGELL